MQFMIGKTHLMQSIFFYRLLSVMRLAISPKLNLGKNGITSTSEATGYELNGAEFTD